MSPRKSAPNGLYPRGRGPWPCFRDAALAAILVSLSPRVRAQVQVPEFADVTERTGITFLHRCGSLEKDWIVEVDGSGAALLDYDGDGDLDIYFVNASLFDLKPSDPHPRNALYRNDGGWKFTDVTDEAGVGDEGWGSGASVADLDNDGHLDLYISNWGPNVVYRNRGDGAFERMKDTGAEDPGWASSACLARWILRRISSPFAFHRYGLGFRFRSAR